MRYFVGLAMTPEFSISARVGAPVVSPFHHTNDQHCLEYRLSLGLRTLADTEANTHVSPIKQTLVALRLFALVGILSHLPGLTSSDWRENWHAGKGVVRRGYRERVFRFLHQQRREAQMPASPPTRPPLTQMSSCQMLLW